MKKCSVLVLFLFTFISSIYSDDIYDDAKKSVIYVKHVIYLDKEKSLYPNLFKRIERQSESPLLNTYFPIQSGSGFIITEEGYALTNRHVILIPRLELLKNQIGYNYAKSLLEEYGNGLTEVEKDHFINDFYQLIKNGRLSLMASQGDQDFEAKILCVAKEDEPDIALIQLMGEADQTFSTLKLAPEESINEKLIGETVYSLGYPLGLTIESIFKDHVASMNRGNISAYRSDELGIQHNAAISKGNSGGPLINENREVLGMNTAQLEEGNSLFYAIATDKIFSFLYDFGYENIIKWNARTESYSQTKDNLRYNIMGEIESSSDLLVYADEGAKIYVDGLYIGTAPMYYTLKKDVTEIRIEGDTGIFNGKIRRLASLSGTTTLTPSMERKLISTSFTGEDNERISVYADGRYLGTTPLSVELSEGDYDLEFESDNRIFMPFLTHIGKDNHEIQIQGERGYPLEIIGLGTYDVLDEDESQLKMILGKSNQNQERKLVFKKDKVNFAFFPDDDIVLPGGTWILSFIGFPQYKGLEIPITMKDEGNVLDMSGPAGSGDLLIRNLPKGSDIFADGILQDSGESDVVQLPLGIRNISIWNPKYEPYDTEVSIFPDDSSFITYEKKTSHSRKARRWMWGGLSLGAGGLALALIDTDPYALDRSDSYEEYKDLKHQIGVVSSSLIIAGVVALIPALVEWGKSSKQKKEYRTLLESQNDK